MVQRILTGLLALGLAGCSSLPLNAVAPKVSVADVDLKSLGLFEQRFDVGLRVNNPNDFDLKIEALDFELELNGRAFARGQTRTTILVPAASGSVVRVDAVTQSDDLIRQIRTLLPGLLKGGVSYRMTGRVKTDKSSRWFPFEQRGIVGGDGKNKPEGKAI